LTWVKYSGTITIMNKLNEIKEMKKDISSAGGQFYTHQYIDNSGYVDFYFIGTYKGEEVIWNVTLSTMRGEYYSKVNNIASDEAYDMFPYPEDRKEAFSFKKLKDSNYSELIDNYPKLTTKRMKYIAKRMMELFDSGEVSIEKQLVEIDEEYEYGIGLHAHIDVKGLNEEDVVKFIDDFNAHGMFMYDDCNESPVTLTAEELGVEVYKNKFVTWKDGFNHNTVGINMDAIGDE
jgi:hypothetical protein